jgi:zinc protease
MAWNSPRTHACAASRGRMTGQPLLLAALLLTALAILAPAARAQLFNPKTYTLDNGLEIVVIENHRAPVVTHMVWYKVGAADEAVGQSGIAHMLEHLMFKGTPTYPDGKFSEIVARNGGQENAFTSQDYTGYFQTVAADRLELMMQLESDRMTNLVLSDAIIEPERQVVLEERRSRVGNNPGAVLSEQVNAATWLNHPYRLPVIGWEHEIEALTRDQIIDFYRRWYAPNNAILVVAGDVEPEKVRALAEKYYGVIPRADTPARVRPTEPSHKGAREVVHRDARVEQPSWSRRYLAPSYSAGDSEYAYALEVLSDILGGGTTSRLYRSLVVEGDVAVSAGAWYSADDLDMATFGVAYSPKPGIEMTTVTAALESELAKLLADGVTEDEVARSRQRLLDSTVFARDSLSTAARVFGTSLTTGQTVADVEAWPQRIAAVTADQVNAAARAVLRPESSTTGILLSAKPEPKSN